MAPLKFVVAGALLVFLLAACSSQSAEPTVAQQISAATSTAELAEPTNTTQPELTSTITDAPTATDTPEPAATATLMPTDTPEPIAHVSDPCLACHMDKDELIQTATPVEEVPSESSGVG